MLVICLYLYYIYQIFSKSKTFAVAGGVLLCAATCAATLKGALLNDSADGYAPLPTL